MSNHQRPPFVDSLKKLLATATGIIAGVTVIIQFIKLWQGNQGLVTIVLLALSLVVLWGFLWYVYSKQDLGPTRGFWNRVREPVPVYSTRLRAIALWGIFILPIGILLTLGYILWPRSDYDTNKVEILIARIEREDQPEPVFTSRIIEELNNLASEDIKIEVLNRHISVIEGGKTLAREIGKEYEVDIVVWGYHISDLEIVATAELVTTIDIPLFNTGSNTLKNSYQFRRPIEAIDIHYKIGEDLAYQSSLLCAWIYLAKDETDTALRFFNKARELGLDRPLTKGFLIAMMTRATLLNSFDESLAAINEVIRLDSTYAEAYFLRSALGFDTSYYMEGDIDLNLEELSLEDTLDQIEKLIAQGIQNNITDIEKGLFFDSRSSFGYAILGSFRYFLGDTTNSFLNLKQAIKLDTTSSGFAQSIRGLTYSIAGKHQEALADFNSVLNDNPNSLVFFLRAQTYSRLNELDNAINDYTEAIRLYPNYADAYIERGLIYQTYASYEPLDDYLNKAISDYSRAIEIDPENHEYYRIRGSAYNSIYEWFDKASADFEMADELHDKYHKYR